MLATALIVGTALPASAYAQVVTGPPTTFQSGPEDPTPTNDPTPTFTFSSTDPLATFECAVDDGQPAACSSPYTTAVLADGPHTVSVRAVDALQNPGDWATRSFTVDTAAPGVTIDSGPADSSTTSDRTPTFEFSSNDLSATFQCLVDGGQAAACDSPFTAAALSDGQHSFEVRAADSAGNQGSAASTFTVDTTAPTVSIDSGPNEGTSTNDATPTFGFSSSDSGATFDCSVDDAAFAACSSPRTTATLLDGPHTFAVRAVDAAGNRSAAVARHFTVDTAAPSVTIGSGPGQGATINDPTPTFGFSSNETGVQFQCAVDSGAFASCSSPHTTAALTDDTHTFSVRATDAAGNQGTAASRGFTVDTVAPDATIDAGPADPIPTADTTPTFVFSSDDLAAVFQCSLDGAAFADCDSPHTTAALSEGAHQLEVRAVDPAGNQGPAATRDFTVDSSVPTVTFTAGPEGPTRERRPTFTFTSVPGATFQCKLDAAAVPCASGSFTPAADLADGEHFFEVTATSPAAVSGSGPPRVFTVDTTGPETVIVAAPPAQTTERTPSIEFVSPEADTSFECSVDGGSFVPCSSPWTTPSLALGPHRVEVRALDALGNPDSSPALAEFTVAAPPSPPPPPPPPVLNVDAGVKELAGSLVSDIDRAARRLATTEMRTILRRGGVTVRGMSALVPGTLAIRASAPARGSSKTVLAGSHSFASPGTAPLVLKPTPAGRTMMTRYATIPLLLRARFTTADGLALSANREAQLVRDYLTAGEAKRAVARRLAGLEGARVKSLAVLVKRRCASNCLRVQASWLAKQRRWTATGRARQVEGRLLARLGAVVSARH